MGYSPQVSVVLSAQEEGKCQSWTMGHRWGNSSPNPGCRQRQLSHDVCEKSQGACCDGLSSPGNGAAPGGQGWKHRGSSCSLAGTEPRYWRCPVLTPLSWAAPGGVGCCGSPTGAVNSRLAGYLLQLWAATSVARREDAGVMGTSHIYGLVVWSGRGGSPWAAHSPQAALWACSGFSWLPALLCPHPAPAMVTPAPQELLIGIVWSLWKL